MRYFLFSYCATADNGTKEIQGEVRMGSLSMPSNKLLKEAVIPMLCAPKMLDIDPSDVVIRSIYEFKDEQDYKNFCDESDISNEILSTITLQ